MALMPKRLRYLQPSVATIARKIKQRPVGQPHPPPFIGNWSSTSLAAHFDGKNSVQSIFGIPALPNFTVEKVEIFGARNKAYPVFVEDADPFVGCPVQFLATAAVAQFSRLGIREDFVSNGSTVA